MDAVGSERAAIYGVSEGGPMAALFAATHPDRTRALILLRHVPQGAGGAGLARRPARRVGGDDRENGWRRFGDGPPLEIWAPSVAGDARVQEWWGAHERHER